MQQYAAGQLCFSTSARTAVSSLGLCCIHLCDQACSQQASVCMLVMPPAACTSRSLPLSLLGMQPTALI